MKLFRGLSGRHDQSGKGNLPARTTRRSSGLAEFNRTLAGRQGLCILDIGPTSASNIQHLTELGHRVYSEDVLLASKDPSLIKPSQDGATSFDEPRFLTENLAYPSQNFDAVLCWDIADFMDEPLVKPMVGRIWSILKPGGLVLAFFHTKDADTDAPCYRYHIADADNLELQPITVSAAAESGDNGRDARALKGGRLPAYRLRRVFNNRHIENLFRDFTALKFFLARDNVREVLITR
jgi:hypothetical protein